MLKISCHGLVLFLPLLVSACADDPAATASPVAQEVSQAAPETNRHCETVETTGSRTHRKTICRTDDEESQDHDRVDNALTRANTQQPSMPAGR